MICITCATATDAAATDCPNCGRPMRPLTADDTPTVVLGSALSADDAGSGVHGSTTAVVPRGATAHPALAVAARGAALLWRQPAVRTAVRTGAGAVALSMAMGAARGMLTSRAARRAVAPTIADLLAPRPEGRRGFRGRRDGGHGEVVETFIYIRRVVER